MSTTMDRSQLDMKAIELAAQSQDPRVRGVAIRRLEIEREIEPLDGFLSFYCKEAAAIVPVTKAVEAVTAAAPKVNGVKVHVPPVPVTAKPATRPQGKKGKTVKMITAANAAIVARGKPMLIQELFDTMHKDHPDLCLASPESMRARLAEHKNLILKVDARGYWPAGVEPPALDA